MLENFKPFCPECSSQIIDKQSFSCYEESPTHITYRARLEGTSERDSDTLISVIEEWVRGEDSIIVAGVRMPVDALCSVIISSLNEPECLPPPNNKPEPSPLPSEEPTLSPHTTPSTESTSTEESIAAGSDEKPSQSPPDNTPAIIGGSAVAIALIIAIVVIAITVLVLKNHRMSTKKSVLASSRSCM